MIQMTGARTTSRSDVLLLRGAAVIYLAAFVYHSVAHEVRGVTPPMVYWSGWTLQIVAVIVVVMVFRGHHRSVPALFAVSAATWVGLAAVHLPPAWGPMSEPWRHHHHISPMWWASLYATLAGGVLATAVAGYVLRRNKQSSEGS